MSEDLSLAPVNETHALAPHRGQSEVLSVIRHTVVPGKEQEYQAWLREIVPIAETAEGHRGVNVIRPHAGSRTYTVVLHFDALEHLERWLASDVRKQLILKVQHLLEQGDQVEIKTGLEFWFTPPASEQKRAKPVQAVSDNAVGDLPFDGDRPVVVSAAAPCGAGTRPPWPGQLCCGGRHRGPDDLCDNAPVHSADCGLAIPLKVESDAGQLGSS